jgi:segregation and condensation protein B
VIKIVHNLMDDYQAAGRGMQIIELDGSFQMCTSPEMYDYVIQLTHQPKKHTLTDVMLETLAIVAYKQPVTKAEIEQIRGVSCSHAINRLLEYGLITEAGRLNAPGRPILFATTEEFLRTFGVQSVDNLPSVSPEQMESFKTEAEEEVQMTLDI